MEKVIHKSYKFRLYPTEVQKVSLAKHFGSCRFVFNRFLHESKEKYLIEKTSLNYYDNASTLTQLKKDENFSWLKEVNSQALQASIRNLDIAYRKFFTKQNKFPRFKSKHDKQSFKVPQNVELDGALLKIPKFKEGIKVKVHREIRGKILFATISKTPTDKYFVSVTCEQSHIPFTDTDSNVGIDTGISTLAVLSDGKKYENPRVLKSRLSKLKYNQRQLSKKEKGSNSRNRQRKQVALCHEKITNFRKDYLHKVSTEIIENQGVVVVEDLNIKGIMGNHILAQAMSDVSLGEFYRQLEYKADWNNRSFVKIDRWFPSSKTCSSCNWVNQNLKLSDRKWKCESCNQEHDRDENASKNILKQGLNILSSSATESDSKQKQVEALSLDKSTKPEAHGSLARG